MIWQAPAGERRDVLPASGTPGSSGATRSWPTQALGAVLVVVAALAGAMFGLAQPGGAVRADDSEGHALSVLGPQVVAGEVITLPVTAQEDRLAAVGVMMSTYLGTIDCTLRAELVQEGQEVAATTTPCGELRDNEVSTVLRMDPITGSAGQEYVLELTLAPGSTTGPAVWLAPEDQPSVVTMYDPRPRMVDHLGRVMDRMADYAAPWGAPAAVVALVVAAVAAVAALVVRPRWGLAAVVVLVVARGLVWTVLVPPLLAMDEGAHFANVQFIAEEGALPNQAGAPSPEGAYSASLEALSDAVHVSAYPPSDRPDYGVQALEDLRAADDGADTGSDGTGPASTYPPGYYAPAALLYLAAGDDTVAQLQAVRLWSVLLGAAAIVLAWLFAGEAFPRHASARAGLTVAVALQPMLAHQFAIVNNDALVIAAGFGALWAGARLTRSATAPRVMLLAGVVVGMGLLGKPFAVLAVVPVALGWLLGKVRFRVTDVRVLLGEPAWAALGVGATFGLWYVVAALLGIRTGLGFGTGSPTGPTDLGAYLQTQFQPGLQEFRGLWVRQFWGLFGWVNTPLPEATYDLLWWCVRAVGILVVVWLVALAARPRQRSEEVRHADRLITMCVASVVLVVAGLYLIEYGYFAATGSTNLLQGRYLLMTVPAVLALPPLLVQRVSKGRWAPTATTWVLALGMFALHVQSVDRVVRHFFL